MSLSPRTRMIAHLHAETSHARDIEEALKQHRGRSHENLRRFEVYASLLDEKAAVWSDVGAVSFQMFFYCCWSIV